MGMSSNLAKIVVVLGVCILNSRLRDSEAQFAMDPWRASEWIFPAIALFTPEN